MAHEYYHKDKFRLNAKPKTSKLILTEKQRNQLNYLFSISDSPGNEIFTTEIWNESAEDQKNAKEYIIYQGIPVDLVDPTNSANRDPTNRWKIRWSDKKNGATLYQCSCGSDMQAASKTPIQKQRPVRQLYEFNGCLAFVRLEIDVDKKVFKRVHGYLDHSEACHRSLPKKNAPKISINCDIRDMTELLIRTNASTNDILSLNQQLVRHQLGGRLILRNDLKGKDEHFVITAFDVKDARRWIKSHPQPQWDFDAGRSVEHNLRELFGSNSSDADLREATIYYKPRDNRYDYTLLILATEEQRLQAWKYGHQKYIVLDGSFQTGSRKLQMYVIMIIDEYKRGIPVGYLLFSRPCHTDLMVASNHEYGILRHLLETYKNLLSQETGESFAPKVAIIDFGFKERLACSEVWPCIYLVFSPFQVHQCWTNKIDQLLGNVGDNELTRHRIDMKKFLNDMIIDLQQCTNEHEIRIKIQETEKFIKDRYNEICLINTKILALYDGQLEFITYLKNDWVNELMHMWTFYGRKKAADILDIDVNSMPWTTEYLEGFRSQFNSKRILRFQRKGHVLRLDALGVIALFDHHINTIAFDDLDPRKEEEANLFLIKEKIKFIEFNGQYLFVRIQCDVKNPEYVPSNKNMDYYIVCLAPLISCHCFNFLLRGGACSHIRAAIKVVNWMRQEPRTRSYFNNLEHWEMPHVRLNSRFDKCAFGVGTSSAMNEGTSAQNPIAINDTSSTQSITNSLIGSTEKERMIQSWNNDLSFNTNRLMGNMNDLITVFKKLGQNQTNIPDGISEDLKILDNELLTRLNTLIQCDKSKELMTTLWQIRQNLDPITNKSDDLSKN
ncbi:5539_t:CDS:2 [Funneliformis geosporum]|uniref:14412_t:CDS:1 n=1 Tax=Funneliformis geosporum TaxID=1117311 RepID=A0A9W4SGA0_9GLOM|nr:5539_t:CDS:2 [Funneliformis geosporum]CAI2167966.1 14412_t:CDS:2 [Funneliformis geosporum]